MTMPAARATPPALMLAELNEERKGVGQPDQSDEYKAEIAGGKQSAWPAGGI
jgi:hypothetical protein